MLTQIYLARTNGMSLQIIIIVLAGVVLYPYVIYPFFLFIVSGIKPKYRRTVVKVPPMISIIIPVYNGESLIEDKAKNLRLISYPVDKLEIIFVSDGSTDDTNKLLHSLQGVKVIVIEKRVGKELALKEAINFAEADLICLTDMGVLINADGVSNMVSHFTNSQVGAVSSVDRTDFKSFFLETFHVAFENKIRILEANISSSVGVSGSFFMARKIYLEKLSFTCCSDLAIALECVKQNVRVAVEPCACGYYGKSAGVNEELNRKVRTITQGINTLLDYRFLLNPFKYGIFSWQLYSHKIFRWVSPIALVLFLLLLLVKVVCAITVMEMLVVGVVIVSALFIPSLGKKIITNFALFGVYIVAIVVSIVNVVAKKKKVIWEPTQRTLKK